MLSNTLSVEKPFCHPRVTAVFMHTYNIIPKKFFGQHFLESERTIGKIASCFTSQDTVLEIGSGTGRVTFEILKKVSKLYAVEKDVALVRELRKAIENYSVPENKLVMICGDYLKISKEMKKSIDKPYKIFGNIPYHITHKIIADVLVSDYNENIRPTAALLMLQKEVAERVIGRGKNKSCLTILSHFYSKPEMVEKVSRNCFSPLPKVDSALVYFTIFNPNPHLLHLQQYGISEPDFLKMVHTGFSSPRKKLKNNLSPSPSLKTTSWEEVLNAADIPLNARAEELSVEAWVQLAIQMRKSG